MAVDEGFTRSVPPSDSGPDDLAAMIDARINARVQPLYARIATVNRVVGSGQIAVQSWDDEFEGQQLKARTAGVAYDPGDTVLMLPTSPTEWVVVQKFSLNAQDRQTISEAELRNDAIRTRHVAARAITPALLQQDYYTQAQVDNRIDTRVPVGDPTNPVVRLATLNTALDRPPAAHAHPSTQVTSGPVNLQYLLNSIHKCMVCLRQNRNSSLNNVCAAQLKAVGDYV